MYHGNKLLVDDLCAKKERESCMREHPDFPENPAMAMYYDACAKKKVSRFQRICITPSGSKVLLDISVAQDDVSTDKMSTTLEGSMDPNTEAP